MEKQDIKRYIFIAFLAVLVCVTVQNFSVCTQLIALLLSSLKSLVIGFSMAYIFNIIMNFLEKHFFSKKGTGLVAKVRRPVCIICTLAIIVTIIILVIHIIVPEMVTAFGVLYDEIPSSFTTARDYITLKLKEYPDIQKEISSLEFDWTKIAEKASKLLTSGLAGILSSAVGIIGGLTATIANIVLGVIFAIYFLFRKDKLLGDINRIRRAYFSKNFNRKSSVVFSTANETFQSFFVGQFVEAIILGSLCFIGMKILKLPYAAMSGTLVGVTALIPIVGAFIGAGVSAFIILTVSPMKALIFLIFLVILQQVEGNLIYPKVVGTSVGLPSLWTLAAVTIGGGLFGVLGMILGVPLAGTLYKLSFKVLEKKESELGLTEEIAKVAPVKTKKITAPPPKKKRSNSKK